MTTMSDPADPIDLGLRLSRALEQHGVSHAIGGALAYGIWGIPRTTLDLDMNVFVEPHDLDPVFASLRSLAIDVDEAVARRASEVDGMFTVRVDRCRIDLFTASIEFAWIAEKTRVKKRIGNRETWFLSAESLAVFKLLFFRTKDIADLERLVEIRGPLLDTSWVRQRLVEIVGEDDERIIRWDRMVDETD
jgi:hypothetical protein